MDDILEMIGELFITAIDCTRFPKAVKVVLEVIVSIAILALMIYFMGKFDW